MRAAGLAGERDDARGRAQGSLFIAPDRMHLHICAVLHQREALAQAGFVLGMNRDAAAAMAEHAFQALILGNQQAAGRRAHEDLHAGAARHQFGLGERVDILFRGPDEEGVIDPGAAFGAIQLVLDVPRVECVGIGVRHLEDRGHAAERGTGRAGFEIFLMGEAGLPEMHLGIDGAGKHRQPLGRKALRGLGVGQIAERGDSALSDAEVGLLRAVHGPDRAAEDRQIEGIFHPGRDFRADGEVETRCLRRLAAPRKPGRSVGRSVSAA